MRIKGNLVFPDEVRRGVIEFSEQIEGIYEDGAADLDFGDAFIGPGLIDVHFHGAMGENFNESDESGTKKILEYCLRHGTTSCLAGITTDTVECMSAAVVKIAAYMKSHKPGGAFAELLGVHLEGPFLNPEVCGAMNPRLIIPAEIGLYQKWEDSGVVKMITLAPEQPGARELIAYIKSKDGCVVSAGHTNATYEQMREAALNGVSHVTHFYNAMTGLHHRQPGTAGGALFSDAALELITDDIHVHPAMCNLVYKLKKPEQVCLVTDSVAAAGLPDGEYEINSHTVFVSGGRNTLADGTLAGSSHTMDRAVKNTARFVPVNDAWTMASYTPAKELGLLGERGVLKPGNFADFAVLSETLLPEATFVRGKLAWKA